jgi:hypothetical protein
VREKEGKKAGFVPATNIMSAAQTPSSTDLLRSLRLIRSAAPEDRKRGIALLSKVHDDPRVKQVLEQLYQNDPDPSVRDIAWQALQLLDPSVARPDSGQAASSTAPRRPSSGAVPRQSSGRASIPRQSSVRALFLLSPANATFFAKELKRIEHEKRRGRIPLWLAVIALLVVGLMWAYIIGADHPDDKLVITAVALTVAVGALTMLGVIRRRGGLLRRRVLRGQVVECTGHVDDDGDYKILLHYRFRTPTDKVLTGEVRQIRNDLRQMPLPVPGTPVAVFYRNPRSYRLL